MNEIAKSPKPRRRLRWAIAAACALSVLTWCSWFLGPTLRSSVRVLAEDNLGGLLRGQVQINRVAKVSLGSATLEGVFVVDPRGKTVLAVDHLRVDFDLAALLRSEARLTRMVGRGVRARLIPSEVATLSLFEALLPKKSAASETAPSTFAVHFESIEIDHAKIRGDVPGLSGIDAQNVLARARIDVGESFAAHVSRIEGSVIAPFSKPVVIERGLVRVKTDPAFWVQGRFVTKREGDRVRVRVSYGAQKKGAQDELALALAFNPVSLGTLLDLGIPAPETLISDLKGHVRIHGPLEHLRFRATVSSDAGDVFVQGSRKVNDTTVVRVTTPSLSIERLLAYAPPATVHGTFDAVAPHGKPIELKAMSPTVEAYGLTLEQVRFAGDYENERLTLKDTGFAYAGGRFNATGFIDSDGDLRIRIRSFLPDTTRDPFLRREGLRARVETDLTIAHDDEGLSAKGKLGLSRISYEGMSASTLVVEGSASGDPLAPTLNIRGSGTDVVGWGRPFGTLQVEATGAQNNYTTRLHALDPEGREARAKVRFAKREHTLRIVADSLTLSVPGRPGWNALADVVIDPDGVSINNVHLENGEQKLDMKGRFSYSRQYRVDAKLERFDIGGLRELIGVDIADLDGTADGEVALTGVPGHPRIDARGSIENGVFLGMTGLGLTLNMVFADARFDIDGELVLPDNSRMALLAGGTTGPGRDWTAQLESGTYEFTINFERVPFEVSRPWLAWLNVEPPRGNVSALVRGEGTLKAPVLQLTTRLEQLAWADVPPINVEVDLTHDSRTLTLRSLRVADDEGRIVDADAMVEASLAELMDPASLRASLTTRPITLRARWPSRPLRSLPGPARIDLPIASSGELSLTQGPNGPRVDMEAHLGFLESVAPLESCGRRVRPLVHVSASAEGDRVQATLDAEVDREEPAQAKLEAFVDVPGLISGTTAWSTPRTNVEVAFTTSTAEDLPVLCDLMAGPLKMSANAKDVLSTRPQLSFSLSSPALQLAPHESQRQKLGRAASQRVLGRPLRVAVDGGIEGERISLIARAQGKDPGSLEVFASVPRTLVFPEENARKQESLEAKLRFSQFELSSLFVTLPVSLRAGGRLEGEARIAVDLDTQKVKLDGAVDLSKGHMALPALGQELSDASANLTMRGDTVTIRNLEARDFEGKARVDGTARFDTFTHVFLNLAFALRDFPVRREGAQVSKLSGGMNLRAELDEKRMRSELRIGDLRIDLPNDLGQELQDLDPRVDIVVVGEEREKPPEEPYLYEVRVVAQNPPFRVQRTDLSAEVRTDLTVRYRAPQLSIAGSAELTRGSFELYGKRFDLQQSQLAFDGDTLDPLVNLYAIHRIGGDEIGVRLEGRLSEPSVSFTHSDPAVTDKGEIIAQLLGGRSSDTSSSDDATGAAASFLAGATAGLLTEEVRREFGGAIPVLAIESGQTAFKSARIRAGVQLDRFIEKRLGPLRHVVRGAYVEGFVAPGVNPDTQAPGTVPQSRGGGLLELRFPADFLGSVEYRPVQNWRLDVAWEP